jgi:hypothetical protein
MICEGVIKDGVTVAVFGLLRLKGLSYYSHIRLRRHGVASHFAANRGVLIGTP